MPTEWPDPVTDPEASLHTTHNIPVARRIVPTTPKERLVVVAGEVVVETENARVTLKKMQWIDVPPSGAVVRNNLNPGPGGPPRSGRGRAHRGPLEAGDPHGDLHLRPRPPLRLPLPRRRRVLVRLPWALHAALPRRRPRRDSPGAILAAGMGEEHGVVDPSEVFEGVGFATQLEGEGRDGHLWRPVHGDPVETR